MFFTKTKMNDSFVCCQLSFNECLFIIFFERFAELDTFDQDFSALMSSITVFRIFRGTFLDPILNADASSSLSLESVIPENKSTSSMNLLSSFR